VSAAIELRGVWKRYRQRQPSGSVRNAVRGLFRPQVRTIQALRGVDLTIQPGEIVAYAGPNGAGKSTTIKLLSGLLAPDEGSVRALGMDPVRQRTRYVARIGVAFGQRTELWWDQPVAATFEWKRVVWDIPRERYERMVALVKPLFGIEPFFRTLARELSLGQRMRADLALALIHEPDILLLDEPTIGLDVLAKRTILQAVKDLNRERGLTVLVTSHDMADLEQLAGRIVFINEGSLAFDGDFRQLRRQFGDRRRLALTMASGPPPTLSGAELLESAGGRHEYAFDAEHVPVAHLLAQASAQAEVVDVETHRADIDEVVAAIYERWIRAKP
jgi:ABC-2 type transport system ATP-binding protein